MHAVCATMRRRPSCKHLPLKVNSNVYKSITLIAICRWPRMAFSMQPSPKTVHCLRHFASRRSVGGRSHVGFFRPSSFRAAATALMCESQQLYIRLHRSEVYDEGSHRNMRRRNYVCTDVGYERMYTHTPEPVYTTTTCLHKATTTVYTKRCIQLLRLIS